MDGGRRLRAEVARRPPPGDAQADRGPGPGARRHSLLATTVQTRHPAATDVPAITALIELYVPSGTLLPRSEAFVAAHAHDFVVAVHGGRVVGCVHLDEYAPSLAEIRSLAVDPASQGLGIGAALVTAAERLGRVRGFTTVFAVSNNESFFRARGYVERHIPELDLERSEVSRFKGVYAKELGEG